MVIDTLQTTNPQSRTKIISYQYNVFANMMIREKDKEGRKVVTINKGTNKTKHEDTVKHDMRKILRYRQ